MVYCQAYPKKHFVPFEEKNVPEPLKNFEVEVVTKKARKPLQSDHRWIKIAFFHVSK
jgi:hypothetical protein